MPVGCTAFHSHSNSNMLIHPARGRWLVVVEANCDGVSSLNSMCSSGFDLTVTGADHRSVEPGSHCFRIDFRSHSNSIVLTHPAPTIVATTSHVKTTPAVSRSAVGRQSLSILLSTRPSPQVSP